LHVSKASQIRFVVFRVHSDPRRLVQRQKYKWLYRWQWLYLPPLYGVLALKFRYQDFFETFGGYA
jgi:hypothetical protein